MLEHSNYSTVGLFCCRLHLYDMFQNLVTILNLVMLCLCLWGYLSLHSIDSLCLLYLLWLVIHLINERSSVFFGHFL